ncbi:hypothetical protein EDB81DRAFT_778259 [Dactylonectria macrodidyma]|uniref:ARB-07466-like C-terminal domain-containing protein n=1 Tax=Dactylonectria macrodidyma TaxID=307937 RepID=A0A9P9JLV6_9HYPO|nr:hypothetical protein EDB81DRAFT_778259 [Dactylonectria macrodidyma]
MLFSITSLLTLLAVTAHAAVNEPCYGKNGYAGVCVTTSTCSKSGGVTISGACPKDPANVKCCSKPACGSGGNCRWISDCAGSSKSNQCPGPSQFKCCSSSARGFGGYKVPKIPSVGVCKAVAVKGAQKVVAAWPGRVREIGCYRPKCSCSTSDHCCGRAIDFMISDAGSVSACLLAVVLSRTTLTCILQKATISGQDIAEWVMNHRAALNVKYVIWGQRIWEYSADKKTKSWTKWRSMNDRKSLTANHW